MEPEELRARLALWRCPGIGPQRFRGLLDVAGSARLALVEAAHLPGLDAALRQGLRQPDWAGVDLDLAWCGQAGHHLLHFDGPGYPARLAEVAAAPPLLFLSGDAGVLQGPALAVVGSRNPTHQGAETARAFARHLAGGGLRIVSGLALGVDAAAHRGALDAAGLTLGVLGCGPDRVYPAANARLAADMLASGGAVVSEFPVGTRPRREYFPRRNRIIAGLSLGTLVVEAAVRSGSLITARLAAEQGREVFAIPGSIHNPLARGCHRLIREGAKLVETAADILEELGPLPTPVVAPGIPAAPGVASPDAEQAALLAAMGWDPVTMDALVERTGCSAEVVSSMLLILELDGWVQPGPGASYTRTAGPDGPSSGK